MKISKYWKAVVATLATGAGGLSTAMNDDTVTSAEASTILIAVVTAAVATWAVPNRDKGEA
ncbi:hypothetical protein [Streptomyces phaeochromogenes]